MKHPLLLMMTFILASCANSPSDFAEKYHLASGKIELYSEEEEPSFEYTNAKAISATSCDSQTFSRVLGNKQEALQVLKLKATKLNADAVIDYSCKAMLFDFLSVCGAAIKCSGIAVTKVSKRS